MYIYSTRLYFQANKPKMNLLQKNHEMGAYENLPENYKLETVILRDLKVAYGLLFETEFLSKIVNLKIFIVELNDLRGSDRGSFPKIISDLTRSLSQLRNLECVELTQKPGNTSCVFDDSDVDPEHSVEFLRSFETMLHRNTKLQRVNIFFPMLM